MGIFKAYDVRGVYGDTIDESLGRDIGRAVATVFGPDTYAVGRDMRVSAPAMADAFIEGLTESGVDVIDFGMVTTPMVYFGIGFYGYGGGAVVTASHNPAEYIGFKFCREKSIPISYDTGIDKLEQCVKDKKFKKAQRQGTVTTKDIFDDFKKHVRQFLNDDIRPVKVVIDGGNGVIGTYIGRVLDGTPVEIIPLYFEPDGTFPNHEANPLKAENIVDLQKAVTESGADFGVAFDGDADRVVFVDETGKAAPCDLITGLLAKEFLTLEPGACILHDLRSSRVVPETINALGGRALECRVGHSYIKTQMREENAVFAGEFSGHYYFRDNYFSDSGIICLHKVLNLVDSENKPFSEIVKPFYKYAHSGEINFRVSDSATVLTALEKRFPEGKVSRLDGLTLKFGDWWFNVRASNTEPVVRLNLEAPTPEIMEEKKKAVLSVIEGVK